jgi:5'-nucleotidase
MNILLCNDDGINAPGIVALHDALIDRHGDLGGPICGVDGQVGTVTVVAPLTVQSATGHGITFRQPLMIRQVDVHEKMVGVAVDGRPADCVKVACSEIWRSKFGPGSKPDLVVSGMNMGANVGINVLYSGTCAAAIEGAFLGIPSVAVSLHLGRGRTLWRLAAARARRVIERLIASNELTMRTQRGSCVNVNIPITESAVPEPTVAVGCMNTHGMIDAYQRNVNPAGETYFWSSGQPMDFHGTEAGSDVQLLFEGKIVVTPLIFDLTDHSRLGELRAKVEG